MGKPPALSQWQSTGDILPRPHDQCYWLLPHLVLAGEHPGLAGELQLDARLRELRRFGVAELVDLSQATDAVAQITPQRASGAGLAHTRFPIPDFGVPSPELMQAIQAHLRTTIEQGRLSYLHCKAGIGRTGTVAACALADAGLSGEDALRTLAAKWHAVAKSAEDPHSPETEAQRSFVRSWAGGRARDNGNRAR